MNYEATIRDLEEKRDFYAAAVSALKKIAEAEARVRFSAHPTAAVRPNSGKGNRAERTPEQRARASEAARQRWANRRAKEGTDQVMPEPELVGAAH